MAVAGDVAVDGHGHDSCVKADCNATSILLPIGRLNHTTDPGITS